MKNIYYATDGCVNEHNRIILSIDSLRSSASDPSDLFVHVLVPGSGIDDTSDVFRTRVPRLLEKCGFGGYGFTGVGGLVDEYMPGLEGRTISSWRKYPVGAFFRLVIPRVARHGRVLYIDTDMLACRDIGRILDIDIGGACVASAVHTWSYYNTGEPATDEVPDLYNGCLIFDCDKWIERGIDNRFAGIIRSGIPLDGDQELLKAALKKDEWFGLSTLFCPATVQSDAAGMNKGELVRRFDKDNAGCPDGHSKEVFFHTHRWFLNIGVFGTRKNGKFIDHKGAIISDVLEEKWDKVNKFIADGWYDGHDAVCGVSEFSGGAGLGPRPVHSGPMHVCYAIDGDETQARLLVTSVYSLIRSAADPSRYFVHVLTDHGGRSNLHEGYADRLDELSRAGGLGGLEYTECGGWVDDRLRKLRDARRGSMANWFRFSIPWTVDAERCLYLDNDTVFARDPEQLFSQDLGPGWVGVSENSYVSANFDINHDFAKNGVSCPGGRLTHFPQAGVMLIDTVKARRSGFVDRMTSDVYFATEDSDGACYNEPLMYRCLSPDEIHWLPKKYNREANAWLTPEERKSGWQPFDSIADAVIVHMNGGRHKSGKCAEYVGRLWDEYERFVSGGAGKPVCKNTGPIDWSKYVDAVYLIHFTGDSHKERLPNILSELGRVGIRKDDVRIRYTANSRWHDAAVDKFKAEHPGWRLPGWWADVGMATFDILVEALATGLRSIAVFETDCVFVKDTDLLRRYLDTMPENAGIAKLEWFHVGGDVAQVAPAAPGESAKYWEPRSSRTSGAACYIIRRNGMEELLRVLRDFCPGPSDFAMNFCKTDIYVSKGHAAIQRAYPSSKTGGCNAYGKMDLSPYELPDGYDHSTGKCGRCTVACAVTQARGSQPFGLPSFPVPADKAVGAIGSLSSIMKGHPGYREPSCLLARLIHESSPGSDSVVRLLLEQGLRVKEKKPGLPVDEWCWSGGPERLLASLGPQASFPDGSVPLVL